MYVFRLNSNAGGKRTVSRLGRQPERAGGCHRGRRQRSDPVHVVQSGLRSGSGARGHGDQRFGFDRVEERNRRVMVLAFRAHDGHEALGFFVDIYRVGVPPRMPTFFARLTYI